jgi:hypothetical protein
MLPILLVAAALEIFIRRIPNDYTFKKEYMDAHAGEIQTLIVGNSHALYGVNPIFLSSNSFNVSNVSQTLEYDYEILKKYESRLVNLKTVIIPVSSLSFYVTAETGKESWRQKNYRIYSGINKKIPLKYRFEISSLSLKTNIKRVITRLKDGGKIISSSLGWGTGYSSDRAQDLQESALAAAARHTVKNIHSRESEEILEYNREITDSIISLCRRRGADILFFTPPAWKTYRQLLNREQIDSNVKTIEEISQQHSHCRYINLYSDTSFIAVDFYDADHLSDRGAEKLSLLLDSLITVRK